MLMLHSLRKAHVAPRRRGLAVKPALSLALALVGSIAGGLATSTAAQAQVSIRPFYYGGTWSGPLIPPASIESERLNTRDLFDEVADQGFRPLRVTSRTRDTVTIEALDPRARHFRLTVDAYDGEILGHRALSVIEARPERGPNPRIRAVPREKIGPRDATTPDQAKPQKRVVESTPQPASKATPAPAPQAAPAGGGPVAPARDPSQWGKQG